MPTDTKHKLVDNTLYSERHKNGEAKGIIGRCTCGWTTGHRFSGAAAFCAFQDHLEEIDKLQQEYKRGLADGKAH